MNKIFCHSLSFLGRAPSFYCDDELPGSWHALVVLSSGFFSALVPHLAAVKELHHDEEEWNLLTFESPRSTFRFATSFAFDADFCDFQLMKRVLQRVDFVQHLRFENYSESWSNELYDEDEDDAAPSGTGASKTRGKTKMIQLLESLPFLVTVHLEPDPAGQRILKFLLKQKTESVKRHAIRQIIEDDTFEFFSEDCTELLSFVRKNMLPLLRQGFETDGTVIDVLDALRAVLVHADVGYNDVKALSDVLLSFISEQRSRTPVQHSAAAALYTLVLTNTSEVEAPHRRRLLRGARDAGLIARLAPAIAEAATSSSCSIVASNVERALADIEYQKQQKEETWRFHLEAVAAYREKHRRRKTLKWNDSSDGAASSDADAADGQQQYAAKHQHDASNHLLHVDLDARFVANLVMSLAWIMIHVPVATDRLYQLEQTNLVDSLLSILRNKNFFRYLELRPDLKKCNFGGGIRAAIWRVLSFFCSACPDAMLRRGVPQMALEECRAWRQIFDAAFVAERHEHNNVRHKPRHEPKIPHWAEIAPPLSAITALLYVPHRRIEYIAPPPVPPPSAPTNPASSSGDDDSESYDDGDEQDNPRSEHGEDDLHGGDDLSVGDLDKYEIEAAVKNQVKALTATEQAQLWARLQLLCGRSRDEFDILPVLKSFFCSVHVWRFINSTAASQLESVTCRCENRLSRTAASTSFAFSCCEQVIFSFCFSLRFEKKFGEDGSVTEESTSAAGNNEQQRRRTRVENKYVVTPGKFPRHLARFFMENDGLVEKFRDTITTNLGDSFFNPNTRLVGYLLTWAEDTTRDRWCHSCGCYH